MKPEDLVKKYALGKTPEEMDKEQDDLKSEVALRSKEMEQEIDSFSSKTDELKNPDTGKIMAIIRRPTKTQFELFTPPNLLKYRENPEKITPEEALAYENGLYKLMEQLIVMPSRTAKEWKEKTGDDFMAAFQAHLMKTREKMQKTVESFLERA